MQILCNYNIKIYILFQEQSHRPIPYYIHYHKTQSVNLFVQTVSFHGSPGLFGIQSLRQASSYAPLNIGFNEVERSQEIHILLFQQ